MDDINEIKKAIDETVNPLMTAFEEFKTANDARLAEIEKKGAADAVIVEKVEKIEGALASFETLNQKLTLAQKQAEKAEEATKNFAVTLARIPGNARGMTEEQKSIKINEWLRAAVRAGSVGVMNLKEDEQKSLREVTDEFKALGIVNDTAAGYLAPTEYVREIIKAVTEISPSRALVNVRQTMMKSVQIPRKTGTFAAQWVADQGTRSETTGLAYGLWEIPTHEMYALVDISNQMLEDSAFNMESEIRNEASEQFAYAEGYAILNGTGVGRPEGILNNADVLSTNSGSASALTADGLISLFYDLKTAYSARATWGMNRSTIGAIRKLKDKDDQYLWMPGLAQNVPNTILGAPYVELPDMPNVGSGAYPIILGDWSRAYTLVDRIAMEFLRDPYTQATSGNVRFIFRRRLGGQVVLPEAIRKQYVSS